jgi:hypothetical protein
VKGEEGLLVVERGKANKARAIRSVVGEVQSTRPFSCWIRQLKASLSQDVILATLQVKWWYRSKEIMQMTRDHILSPLPTLSAFVRRSVRQTSSST